jgi:hypothetical protein
VTADQKIPGTERRVADPERSRGEGDLSHDYTASADLPVAAVIVREGTPMDSLLAILQAHPVSLINPL